MGFDVRLITQNTDYAIRALCYMAERHGDVISAAELANELQVSWSLIRKILQELHKKGLVRSFKGKGGGFMMEAEPGDIFILELMKMFQGSLSLNRCNLNKNKCTNITKCRLRKKISDIEKYVTAELNPVTIGSLISGRNPEKYNR
jgi:Rrf2 family protein